jgi:hypothetical protein
MATALDRDIRKLLDRAVRKARCVAEDGARKALTEIGLEDAKRPEGLSPAQIELRNRLRTHARSLGDAAQADGSIRANRLVREIAYEHWHRALFARFLVENNLLIDPDHKVAVSLSELEEIAKEEGRDLTELAADWAEPMLPQIFRKDDPALALALPPETKAGIAEIVNGLPRAVFAADDSLGWVYQFWQADNKEAINRSGVKIGADELPAVTQLFTEDYMVLFLLENTLGAWWAAKAIAADPALATRAQTEEELREKTSPLGYRWTYLRFLREPRDGETHETATGPWRPAAGAFEGWPKAAKDITVLDPCMGSGHFLVFALPILVAFRCAEEGLRERAAVKAVLAENLFGLEIDPRCTQIAAFAVALASWKRLDGPEPLPRLNLACSGLAIGLGKTEFLTLAEEITDAEGWGGERTLLGKDRAPLGDRAAARIRAGLERLYELFEKAPYLGSLVDPRRAARGDVGGLFEDGFEGLESTLAKVLVDNDSSEETRETAVTAQGIAKAAELLARDFTLVATNVPYLSKGGQHQHLQRFIEENFPRSGPDLATAFVLRLIPKSQNQGALALVSPWGWFFKDTYSELRQALLELKELNLSAILGSGAFEAISGEEVSVTLTILDQAERNRDQIKIIDASGAPYEAKAEFIANAGAQAIPFSASNNRNRFLISVGATSGKILSDRVRYANGIQTSDYPRFVLRFWEIDTIPGHWECLQSTTDRTQFDAGLENIIRWELGNGELQTLLPSVIRGQNIWGRTGVAISATGELKASLYRGHKYDESLVVLVPAKEADLGALWALCASDDFNATVRKVDAGRKVRSGIVKVPFDHERWRSAFAKTFNLGLPKPYSNDPTQWLFDGHPRGSADPNVLRGVTAMAGLATPYGVRPGVAEHPLQVAVARLLGYHWPRQTGSSFADCRAVAEPDEVDRSGLVDSDGIVPLPALEGEADAATRLRELIRAIWGPDYGQGTIRELLATEDAKANDLATWLADEFFDGHCRLFHQTPFIWHVWDGARGGFSALVNYHRLCEGDGAGRRLLEKLRDAYLGEWIAAQRRAVAGGTAGAEDRLIAAEHLRSELTRIIDGEPPYDIFVRWKPLCHQPVGWEPDIDDGVRLNIRPFLTAKPKNPARKDARILRITPRVKSHAGADRGSEPKREREDFPWFWAEDDDVAKVDFAGGPEFKGRRYNDFHYTRVFKQRARDARVSATRGAAS